MSKTNQREISYFKQGQIDRKEAQKIKGKWNWDGIKRIMKSKYKERFCTKKLSNMYGSIWFRGWNNPTEKHTR
jgi:hypothetical protein